MRHAMVAASHWASTFPAEFDLNKPINFKGVWSGLPRSVYGFIAIGYCDSVLAPHAPGGRRVEVSVKPGIMWKKNVSE